MKNVPALLILATLAALALLAVISSVTTSVPFLPLAVYVVSGASSLGLIAVFLGDYRLAAPRDHAEQVRQRRAPVSGRDAREVPPVAPRAIWPAMGVHNDPVTLSYS
jgi:hypothetical protein